MLRGTTRVVPTEAEAPWLLACRPTLHAARCTRGHVCLLYKTARFLPIITTDHGANGPWGSYMGLCVFAQARVHRGMLHFNMQAANEGAYGGADSHPPNNRRQPNATVIRKGTLCSLHVTTNVACLLHLVLPTVTTRAKPAADRALLPPLLLAQWIAYAYPVAALVTSPL